MKNSEIVYNFLLKEVEELERQILGKELSYIKLLVKNRICHFLIIIETYKVHKLTDQLISLIQLNKNLDEITEYIIDLFPLEKIDESIVCLKTRTDGITQSLHIDYDFSKLDKINQFFITCINV